jgi:hypothetical protein
MRGGERRGLVRSERGGRRRIGELGFRGGGFEARAVEEEEDGEAALEEEGGVKKAACARGGWITHGVVGFAELYTTGHTKGRPLSNRVQFEYFTI